MSNREMNENINKEILPQSMNSDVKLMKQSYFKNIQLTPVNGSNNITISSSQQQTQWEIPISCYNAFWTVLSFKIACTANTNFECIPNNYCPYFNRIELYTAQGNVYLVNQQTADIYSRLACPLNLKNDNRGEEMGPISLSRRSNFGVTAVNPNNLSISDPLVTLLNNNSTVIGIKAPNYQTMDCNITTDASGDAIKSKVYSFRLGDILPDSFFNQNISYWIGKVLYLRVTWNSKDMIIKSIAATDANPTVLTLTNNSTDIAISQINLQCRIEGDESLIQAKKMLSESPSSVLIPFVYNWSQSQNGGGVMQTSFTLASDNSTIFRLYRLYSGIFRTGGNINVDCNNIGGTTTSVNQDQIAPGVYNNIQLYVNGILIEQFNTDPTSLNMMLQQLKEYYPYCSINNTIEMLWYGGYATQFNTDQVDDENINLYSNLIAKGLDASKSNLAINIQYNTTGSSGVGGAAFTGAGQLYLFPVVLKSFIYNEGTFVYG